MSDEITIHTDELDSHAEIRDVFDGENKLWIYKNRGVLSIAVAPGFTNQWVHVMMTDILEAAKLLDKEEL